MLHTLSAKSFSAINFQMILASIAAGDAVVFTAGALFYTLQDFVHPIYKITNALYAYDADVHARGLLERLPKEIKLINIDEWIELTTQHTQIHAWP